VNNCFNSYNFQKRNLIADVGALKKFLYLSVKPFC